MELLVILFGILVIFCLAKSEKTFLLSLFVFMLVIIAISSGCQTIPTCDNPLGPISEYCIPNEEQVITSPGGDVVIGLEIAEVTQTVIAKEMCNSMCAIILITAPHRKVCADTPIGFHQASHPYGTILMRDHVSRDFRIPLEIFDAIVLNTPYEYIYFLTPQMALQFNFVDEIIECE